MKKTNKPITPQFQTWMNFLSSLDMELIYRQGEKHTNADMLSRMKCGTCTQCQMQHEDPKMGKIKTRQINQMIKIEKCKWQEEIEEIKLIKRDIQEGKNLKYRIESNIVKTNDGKIWIPKEKRISMIKEIHTLLIHAGTEKMISYIISNYDMEELKKTITEVIKQCEACQKNKVNTVATKETTVKLSANCPFEKIYMDICGPFRETMNRKRYICGIIDQYSRYVSLTAISKQDDETFKKVIMEKWILRFGAPRELHVDSGKTFESKSFKNLMESMNIEIHFSSPYHHNTNGIIERQFRTIRDCINAAAEEDKRKDWSNRIPEIEYMMNATRQKTLGVSPAELVFGRKIHRERWFDSQKDDKKSMEETPTKRQFQVGDEVLIKLETRTKDNERYAGPYKITDKVHERRYRLRNSKGKELERNVEKLKKFF